MNILVTGANGQLGTCLDWIVSSKGNGVPDHTTADENYYIFAGRDKLDVTDEEAVHKYIKDNHINVVVNCAAYTAVDKAEDDVENAKKLNHSAPKYLADACNSVGAVLIHISTDYVFDGTSHIPYTPDMKTGPTSIYGHSKRMGEYSIIESGCKYIIIRTSWLYSEFGRNFMKTMISKFQSNMDVKVVCDQIGSPTYAMDLAAFIYYIIENNNAEHQYLSRTGIYHCCNNGVASWYDLAIAIRDFADSQIVGGTRSNVYPCKSDAYRTKAKRPSYSVMDNTSLCETFNWEMPYWRDSVCEAVYNFFNDGDYV